MTLFAGFRYNLFIVIVVAYVFEADKCMWMINIIFYKLDKSYSLYILIPKLYHTNGIID